MRTILMVSAAATSLMTTGAWAQTYDTKGTWYGTPQNEVMALSDSLIAIRALTAYDRFEPAMDGGPVTGTSGKCFGSIVIDKGQPAGAGLCDLADGDGDAVVTEWSADGMTAEGRMTGSWRYVGGTGKFEGITGSGTFNAGTGADGNYTNMIDGSYTIN